MQIFFNDCNVMGIYEVQISFLLENIYTVYLCTWMQPHNNCCRWLVYFQTNVRLFKTIFKFTYHIFYDIVLRVCFVRALLSWSSLPLQRVFLKQFLIYIIKLLFLTIYLLHTCSKKYAEYVKPNICFNNPLLIILTRKITKHLHFWWTNCAYP